MIKMYLDHPSPSLFFLSFLSFLRLLSVSTLYSVSRVVVVGVLHRTSGLLGIALRRSHVKIVSCKVRCLIWAKVQENSAVYMYHTLSRLRVTSLSPPSSFFCLVPAATIPLPKLSSPKAIDASHTYSMGR